MREEKNFREIFLFRWDRDRRTATVIGLQSTQHSGWRVFVINREVRIHKVVKGWPYFWLSTEFIGP